MKKTFLILSLGLCLARPVSGRAEGPATLAQCFQWASARSEALKIRQEGILQSEARARAATGRILPRVDWEIHDTFQDPQGVDQLASKGFGGFVEKQQVESKFTARQPLFSGLQEYSARHGFLRESARDRLLLQKAARDLFERTAGAFYAVLDGETGRANAEDALSLAEDRVKELRGFRKLGKARASEVYTAEAHAAAMKAGLRQIQARIVSAREELSFLTGQDFSARPLSDELPSPPVFGTLEDALARAGKRADLRAQAEEVAARTMLVRYEKGAYWPVADVTGNYYTQRATFLEDVSWDVALNVRVPLFQGGSVSARVREASSALRQAELALQEMERVIAHDVRKTHAELSSAVGEVEALEEAAESAKKSYEALREEYGLGLVTNLDVIQALDLLQAQRAARDAARLSAKTLYIRLQVAVEELP